MLVSSTGKMSLPITNFHSSLSTWNFTYVRRCTIGKKVWICWPSSWWSAKQFDSRPHPCLIVILRQLLVGMERNGGGAPQTVWWIYIGGRCTNYRPNKFYSLTLTPPPQSSNHSKSLRFRESLINASTSRANLVKVDAQLFPTPRREIQLMSCDRV